jgi:hypothetical protein
MDAGSTDASGADAAPAGCTLTLAGGYTGSYACQATSLIDVVSGLWTLHVMPTNAPTSVAVVVAISVTGTLSPATGDYTFDSPAVGSDASAGLTLFGGTLQGWSASKGDGNLTQRAGSLDLHLTAAGTDGSGKAAGAPHGSLSADMVAGAAGGQDVTLNATF